MRSGFSVLCQGANPKPVGRLKDNSVERGPWFNSAIKHGQCGRTMLVWKERAKTMDRLGATGESRRAE
jgi:hypothetical protein